METAINPLGKRLQFVFVGRQNATVYFCVQLCLFCNSSEVSVVSVVFCSVAALRGGEAPLAGRRAQSWNLALALAMALDSADRQVFEGTPR